MSHGIFQSTTGGDFVATATDTVTITNGQTNTVEFDILEDIEAFVSGTPNYGWIIKKVDETSGCGIDFKSREAGTPKLVIAFSSPLTTSGGNGCRTWTTLNDEAIAELPTNVDHRRCTIIDNKAPKIVRAFMTPGNYLRLGRNLVRNDKIRFHFSLLICLAQTRYFFVYYF